MGKDRSGNFHPKKGKPSGSKEEGLGLRPTMQPEELEQDLKMTDRYTTGPDTLSPDVHMRHPNRNPGKKQQLSETEDDENSSDKTTREKLKEVNVETITPEELPQRLSAKDFTAIASHNAGVCISIYIPTHKAGVEVNEQQDMITFKNALQEAEKNLKEKTADEVEIMRLLKPGYDLLRNDRFWYNLTEGLVFFIADGYCKFMRLSFSPKSEVFVNSSFYATPLAGPVNCNEYFYLLVMSKKQVSFYKADRFGMEKQHISELPDGVDDVVHFEEKDDQKLFRTGGRGGANFHGIGAGKPDEKKHIELYLEEVDDTLYEEVLHNETAPLLLAGIEYMIPIYKSVTDYNHVWDDAIARGALEYEDENSLYAMAMEKMQPFFKQKLEKAKESYGNKSAGALTTSIIEDVIPAAYYSQVDSLFIRKDAHIWGSFNEMDNKLTLHATKESDDVCLVDKAVAKTIENNGNVFILDEAEMPASSELAAILRYAQ